jgi:hypothetical protein
VLDCIGFTRAMHDIVGEMVRAPVILPRILLADAIADLIENRAEGPDARSR